MADGDEDPVDRMLDDRAGAEVTEPRAVHAPRGPVARAQHLGHLGVPDELDLGVREGAVLHDLRCPQLLAAMDHDHLVAEAREVGRLLHRGVAAAHHHHPLAAEEETVAGGAGRDSESEVELFARDLEQLGRGAAGDDHRLRRVLALLDPDAERVGGEIHPRHLGVHDLGAEALGLGAEHLHQLGAEDRVHEARIVLDLGGDGELAAGLVAAEQQRLEVGAGRVDRGGVPGRAGPDDDDLTKFGQIDLPRRGWPVRQDVGGF